MSFDARFGPPLRLCGAMSEPVHVVIAADDAYALPLAVCVRSIIEQRTGPLEIAVLVRGVGTETKQRLLQSWPSGAPVEFYDVGNSDIFNGLSPWGYVSTTTYARLLIPELVRSTWSRLIYLDADMVVLTDLGPLATVELAGRAVGACPDRFFTRWWKRHGAAAYPLGTRQMFNAGMMVIDLDRWRAAEISSRALATAHQLPPRLQNDQVALNLTISDDWTELESSWNVTTDMYFRKERADYADALARIKIRHFTALKPWTANGRNVPDADLFESVRSRTAFPSDQSSGHSR